MRTGFKASDLWRWDGTVGRGVYAGVGLAGFALKHNLDRLVATGVFHKPWGLFNYLSPGPASVAGMDRQNIIFLGTLVVLALPFIWTGVCLTARRLRSTHLPIWLLIFFFIPLINILFFVIMAVLPPRSEEGKEDAPPRNRFLDRIIPDNALGAALMAQLLVVPASLMAVFLSVTGLGQYGWGLFVGLPFSMGLGSVLIFGYHRQRTLQACLGVACLSVSLLGLALLAVAMEGLVCLMMAAPLGLILATLGGLLGYSIQRRLPNTGGGGLNRSGEAASLIGLVISLPALMGAESLAQLAPPVYSVTSSVVINAPPERVWPQVIQFHRMPPPKELIFRVGVAYPIQARLEGKGVGAVRRCVFSTGPFVEPITCWDEPRRLAFSVTSNPDPLQEWTPYGELHPPHADGYMASQGGQFLLVPLEGGRTRLEGTTWYRHGLWPAFYWKLWSDQIIHTIHLRVLNFIKAETESGSRDVAH